MRGISPVIATVIILAVTIAIAVAVIGWITGLFGAATGGTEQLQIYPDSYINVSQQVGSSNSPVLHLHVVNKGSDVTIFKIETCKEPVSGTFTYTIATNDQTGSLTLTTGSTIVVTNGFDGWVIVKLGGSYSAGTTCDIKVYTKAGNVFTAQVTVKQ